MLRDPFRRIKRELDRLAATPDDIRVTVEKSPRERLSERRLPATRGEIRLTIWTSPGGGSQYEIAFSGGALTTPDLQDVLTKLRELPSGCGYSAVFDHLLYMSEGPDRDD